MTALARLHTAHAFRRGALLRLTRVAVACVCALALVATRAAAQVTPWGWAPSDIGPPASGPISFAPTSIAMASMGYDVNGTADHVTFLSRPITGDATVIARVSSLAGSDPWAQAGVMIRESTDAGAKQAFVAFTRSNGVVFRQRGATDGGTSQTLGGAAGAPVWIKLQRKGSTLTASRSADGVSWTLIGTATVSMAPSVHAGLAVASHVSGGMASAVFEKVMVIGDGVLPPGWTTRDVGSPDVTGGAGSGGPLFTVDGGGLGITGVSDQFRYVYKAVSGNADVVAKVAGFDLGSGDARAGVTVRQSLAAGSTHASLLLSPTTGLHFDRRGAPGSGVVSMWGGGYSAGTWVKLSRRGSTVSAYRSSDGVAWTLVGAQSLSLTEPFYVGLAVASGRPMSLARATFESVSAGVPNAAPSVSLASPTTGTTIPAGGSIAMTATASDSDGTISKVDFYSGTTLIGTDTMSPYAVTWSGVAGGTYIIKAVATDNGGATTASATATVTVTVRVNAPPVVALVSPAAGASVRAGTVVTIEATASDVDGTVARVDFYDGAVLLGSDVAAPYVFSWSGAAAGAHVLTAVARDDLGASTVSAARSLTVSTSNASPTVAIVSPVAGAAFTAPASITLTATAADSDGTVTVVEFYRGTTLIGSDATSPYAFTWTGVAAGTYSITAVARDTEAR